VAVLGGRAEVARVPAAHAARPAWVAAVGEAAVGEAAGGGGKEAMSGGNPMIGPSSKSTAWTMLLTMMATASYGLLVSPSAARPRAKQAPAPSSQPSQKQFATPREAADALIQAAGNFDVPALKEILGADGEDLVSSEDPVQDKNRAAAFAAKAREKTEVSADPQDSKRATVSVGNDDWPLPIPIVKRNGKWLFDTKEGHEEILLRRIGSNELDAIQICRGYVEAQHDYALEKHDGSEVNQYAQRIISSPGKQDGLVWRNADGSLGGPIGEEVGKALEEGYSSKANPYHGYYFKILKGQGPSAPLGRMDFVVNGAMIGGFALAAAPANYRVTGVKTFIVSYEGIVYEKDLGPDTLNLFKNMELYDPGKTWHATRDNW